MAQKELNVSKTFINQWKSVETIRCAFISGATCGVSHSQEICLKNDENDQNLNFRIFKTVEKRREEQLQTA